jgi:putative tricarboxylic transport membrane protein
MPGGTAGGVRCSARLVALVALAALAGGCGNEASDPGADYPSRNLTLIAPADPGGGWDSTARAMAQVIEDGKLSDQSAEVKNVPGAGGTIGLSQLASKHEGDPHQLLVMGLVMVGAIETNDSPTNLSQVTPVASLTTETEAIVVPADSPYESIDDLAADLKKDPGSVSFAGGSAGGTDQILLGLLARDVGADPAETKYVAYSGGGEANAAILSGSVDAGISGLSEFTEQVEAGKMRLLAVSSETKEKVDGKAPATLKDSGFDVEVTNWRGVVAPPGIDEDVEGVEAFVRKLHDSPEWRKALEQNGWTDFFKLGDEYASFLDSETERVEGVIADLGVGR